MWPGGITGVTRCAAAAGEAWRKKLLGGISISWFFFPYSYLDIYSHIIVVEQLSGRRSVARLL